MQTVYIAAILAFFSIASAEAGDNTDTATAEERGYVLGFVDFIKGNAPDDGIIFLPFGLHTKTPEQGASNNMLVGGVYESFYFGTFINSYNDRVWSLGMMRNIFEYDNFGINYYAGLMVGYKGNLAGVAGIPFRESFLFKGNLNPVLSLDVHYALSDQLELHTMLMPLVVLAGFKYNF